MGRHYLLLAVLIASFSPAALSAEAAENPILHADVPDISIIRVGDTYYMSSTTMHMSPGLPIMRSKDLVNWEMLNYAYETLGSNDALKLENGKSAYGAGSWASSLRYHDGVYYVSTFSSTTGRTHIYRTADIQNEPWRETSFEPSLHDSSLFFDDDGRVYMLYGAGDLRLVELEADLTGIKPGGLQRVVITNASAPAGDSIMLRAEGSQLFKHDGKYYLFNITWPRGGMRTVVLHRADKLTGPWEGRLGLQDKGVAQGGMVETPDGEWFAYLFQDHGAVGRTPFLVPMRWQDGWPVLGVDGKAPMQLNLPASGGLIPGIVDSDEFERRRGARALPLVWQWNHNPDDANWSLTERPGFLRIRTGRVDDGILSARNTLTQRTVGPECTGEVRVDVSALRPGDVAGLCLLQRDYGFVGIENVAGEKRLVMVRAPDSAPQQIQTAPLNQDVVCLRAVCDFRDRADTARFYYSLDGDRWRPLGDMLAMRYTLPHFMGYRFGLFAYSTQSPGGHADFDYFRIAAERRLPLGDDADNHQDSARTTPSAGRDSRTAADRASAPDPNFYIYLCFGQSNMQGSAPIEPVDTQAVNERFRMLAAVDFPETGRQKGEWYTATPPLCRPGNGLCPADYFGRTLVEHLPPHVRVGVVNVSVSGCRIELFEQGAAGAYPDGPPGWMAGMLDAYDGDPYGRLVEMGRLAQRRGVIKGILLHQGESNTGERSWLAKVQTVYARLLKDLNLNADRVPLLAGEVVSADQGGVCARMNPIIRELPEHIPTAHVISSSGVEDQADNLHFSSAGYRELGRRYAEKALDLLQPAATPNAAGEP